MKRTFPLLAALLALADCSSKELTCAADQHVCANACVSILSDALNCGACGHACGSGQGCSLGACVDCAANPTACTATAAVACFATADVRFVAQDLTQVGPSLAVAAGPESLTRISGTFFVANDLASTITPFTLAPLQAETPISVPATAADLSHVAAHDGLLWASSSLMSTLVVVDPVAGQVVDEVPLAQTAGEFVNPQGMDFVGTKAYLALAGPGAVTVVDASTPTAPKVLKRIALAQYATAPATAYPSHVLAANGKVYVTLSNIQSADFKQVQGAHGKLVVIDPSTDTVVGDTALDLGPDCLDASALLLSGTTLWVGCGYYDFASVQAGGILPVSIAGSTPQPGAVVKTSSAIDALALCAGKGYAGASESGKVLQFDATTGTILSSADICPVAGFAFVADIACVR